MGYRSDQLQIVIVQKLCCI